jgi:hypothetical protein
LNLAVLIGRTSADPETIYWALTAVLQTDPRSVRAASIAARLLSTSYVESYPLWQTLRGLSASSWSLDLALSDLADDPRWIGFEARELLRVLRGLERVQRPGEQGKAQEAAVKVNLMPGESAPPLERRRAFALLGLYLFGGLLDDPYSPFLRMLDPTASRYDTDSLTGRVPPGHLRALAQAMERDFINEVAGRALVDPLAPPALKERVRQAIAAGHIDVRALPQPCVAALAALYRSP